MNPAAFRAEHEDADVLLPGELRQRLGTRRRPTAAQKQMNAAGPRRERHDGQRDRRLPLRQVAAGRGRRSAPAMATRRAARSCSPSRGCFGCHLADPDAQRDLSGPTGSSARTSPASARRPRATGSTTGSWTRRPGTPTPRCRTCACSRRGRARHRGVPLDAEGAGRASTRCRFRRPTRRRSTRSPSTSRWRRRRSSTRRRTSRRWTSTPKEVYVGEKLIAHYGCFACHAIPGFEDAKPIGTELTEEGSKAVHRLDFGFVHLPHTRQDWFRDEARQPAHLRPRPGARLGREARMPNFRFSTAELDQVVDGGARLPEAERRRPTRRRSSRRARPRSSAAAASSRTTTARAATSSRASAARSARSWPTRRSRRRSSRARAPRSRATGSSRS